MSNPSSFEQLMLEYINRARMDPQGEFDRFIVSTDPVQAIESKITSALNYFNVDLAVYQQQLAGLSAVAPLAWNSALNNAATTHSQLMIAQDTQSHQLSGEAGLGSRITTAGYDNWGYLAENIFAYTESPAYGHAGFFIDWGNTPTGIQNPAGHRNNIMNENLTEVGIGVVADSSGATRVGPYVVTQDFGDRWDYDAQFVGVAYNDNDADNFYSMGEGAGGIDVTLTPLAGSSSATATFSSGGYQIEAASGLSTLTFSGGGLSESVSVDVEFGTDNVKVDLVNGNRVESSATTTLGDGAIDLTLLGQFSTDGAGNAADNLLTGNAGDNRLRGNEGKDTILGGDGNDTIVGNSGNDQIYSGAKDSGNDWVHGGKGDDYISDNDGDDTLIGGLGNDTIFGGDDNDWMYGANGADHLNGGNNDDTLLGGQGTDIIEGNLGGDYLQGDDGDDWIHGGKGADILKGGAGNDTIIGGSGSDYLSGGPGVDWLKGAAGDDVFDFDAISDSRAGGGQRDVIGGGFDNPGIPGGDLIDVSDLGVFIFLAGNQFSDVGQSEVRVESGINQAVVQGDVDGNGVADFEIVIEGITAASMSADDFLGLI